MSSNNIFKLLTIPLRSKEDGPSFKAIAFKECVFSSLPKRTVADFRETIFINELSLLPAVVGSGDKEDPSTSIVYVDSKFLW